MNISPLAFMSYSHIDNQSDNDRLRKLCELISNEVQVQTATEFKIFFDRKDLMWGQCWKQRIEESLDSSTFFIPIVTPNFLKSEGCRIELERFLERQERLRRKDLVLPIYYVKCPILEEKDLVNIDELAYAISNHQWVDWQKLRFASLSSKIVKLSINGLASQISDALLRTRQAELGRDKNDSFYTPRRLEKGDEQNPLPIFLQLRQTEPRKLLEEAMKKKQVGDYAAAKELLLKLIQLGIDWNTYIDLFVDLLYFSISTYDKLEEWTELDHLEKYYVIPTSERIRKIITDDAHRIIRMEYQSQMALVMLRQTRLDEALIRIDEALEHTPDNNEKDSIQILYANALTTRTLINYSKWAYKNGSIELVDDALRDLNLAENLYRKFAKMEQTDELHHLGRYYGISSFLKIATLKKDFQYEIKKKEILNLSSHSFNGNRTAYGKIAGMYCDAYCHYKIGLLEEKVENRLSYFQSSYDLLIKARSSAFEHLGEKASLVQTKILGLLLIVSEELAKLKVSIDSDDDIKGAFENAKGDLNKKGYQFLETISMINWLSTPLN
jgi:hypothetical protein